MRSTPPEPRMPRARSVVASLAALALLAMPTTSQAGGGDPGRRAHRSVEDLATELSRGALGRTAAAKKRWLMGRLSHTYEVSPVTDQTYKSTIEVVGYKGKRNGRFPRVGKVYLGQIWVGRSGDTSAGDEVTTEVILPPKTRFAIKKSVKSRRVRCYKGNAQGDYRRLRGKKCPNRPVRGRHGWLFGPPKGFWHVPRGKWIQVIFPLRSRKRLTGIADSPPACLVGAVKNYSGFAIRHWDAPRQGEKCPLKDGHGPDMGVFVARRKR